MIIMLDIIHGDAQINHFMHAADTFEKGKQLGEHDLIRITGEPDLNKLTDITKQAYVQAGRNVIFVAIRMVDNVYTNEYPPYIKEGVQSISNGYRWGMFNELLKGLGYEVETNEYMMVTKAKLLIQNVRQENTVKE